MTTDRPPPRPIEVHLSAVRAWQANCPVRLWREREGYTRADLAERVAVSHSTLHQWEAGTREPFLSAWIRLAAITGLTLDDWAIWHATRPQRT